jgi:hypothetical protein
MKKIILLTFISVFTIVCSCKQDVKKTEQLQNGQTRNHVKKIKGSFNFLIVSDWGWNGFYFQQEVADQMANVADSVSAKFIVSCGDNFQINGVASTQDPLWLSNFENIYKKPSLLVDWFPVLGNHDYHGSPQAEIDYSKISRRWRLTDHYYSIVRKINDSISARLIFLDTPPFVEEYRKHPEGYPEISKQDTTKQLKWLKETLANSKEQWKLVFGHHPVYSASPFHGNTKEMIQHVKPIFDKYKIQFYFCGHDHDLQHLREKGGKVDYIVTGAGGEPRRDSTNAMSIFSKSLPAFSLVTFKADSMQLNFVSSKGEIVYRYSRKYK